MPDTLSRYIELLKMLQRDRTISAPDIHRKLEGRGFITTKRTVERDLQKLSAMFPIVSDETNRPFGWKYADGATINLIPGLSETEALSFLMLKQFSERLLPTSIVDDLGPYFRAAQQKLSADVSKSAVKSWPSKVRSIVLDQSHVPPKIAPGVQTEVYSALLRDKQIVIDYQASGKPKASEYQVDLYGLVEHGTVLYLVGQFHGYQDIRILALHRIRSVKMLDLNVKRPVGFDLDAYIAKGHFEFGDNADRIQVELHFHDGAGQHLLDMPLSLDQSSRQVDGDTLSISATVLDSPRLHWWLLGFGANVEVIGPSELRDEIQRAINGAAKRYRGKKLQASPT